jgi:hypothetical protein
MQRGGCRASQRHEAGRFRVSQAARQARPSGPADACGASAASITTIIAQPRIAILRHRRMRRVAESQAAPVRDAEWIASGVAWAAPAVDQKGVDPQRTVILVAEVVTSLPKPGQERRSMHATAQTAAWERPNRGTATPYKVPFVPSVLQIVFTPQFWMVIGQIVVNVAFALAVGRDADKLTSGERQTILVSPFVWMLSTLLGGVFVAATYWVMHHSSLAGTSDAGDRPT